MVQHLEFCSRKELWAAVAPGGPSLRSAQEPVMEPDREIGVCSRA